MTITSAMKGLAATVNSQLDKVVSGEFEGGKIESLGLVDADPEENFVQLPVESTQWADAFTFDNYVELVGKMLAGEIVVSNNIEVAPESVITVNYMGNIK